MIDVPPARPLAALQQLDRASAVVVASSARARRWAEAELPRLDVVAVDATIGERSIIVVGGGALIDEVKYRRRAEGGGVELVAVPTIWGSGAETSKIAVVWRSGQRVIQIDDALVPDAVLYVDEFAATVAPERARDACGDVWAHALEGFLSPLATASLRDDLADVLRAAMALDDFADPRWFRLSGLACAGQAASSVGLVHGIAHTLEEPLGAADPAGGWGHARLCATFVAPVVAFDRQTPKFDELAQRHGLVPEAIAASVDRLFDADQYRRALPVLVESWPRVVRDPSSRTNCAIVRPSSLSFFEEYHR